MPFSIIKKNMPMLAVILISGLFRFYNFYQFQYWSGDEELLTATLRHIVWDKSPTLLVQNANLGFGLGSYYHWLLSPIYFAFNFNLILLQSIGSLLGLVTTYAVFLAAREIGGKRLGLFASFIYASSFLISLFDRRLYHLTLDPFLTAIALLSIIKILKGKSQYLLILAVPVGFTFHSDASLAVLILASIATFFIYRPKLSKKMIFGFLAIICLFLLPFVVAQIKYKNSVIGPVIKSITRPLSGQSVTTAGYNVFPTGEFVNVLSRAIFTNPSNFIEQHFCYCKTYPKPLFGAFSELLAILIVIGNFAFFWRKRDKESAVLWIMFFSFVFGIIIFNLVFKGSFVQHYFMVLFPIYAIMIAQVMDLLFLRYRKAVISALFVYFLINFVTLINSSVKYPLESKIALVASTFGDIEGKNYSIESSGDSYIQGGGWTELFILKKHPPVSSYWFSYWDWIYRAYSLFPLHYQAGTPERTVVFEKDYESLFEKNNVINTHGFKDIKVVVLDNSKGSD